MANEVHELFETYYADVHRYLYSLCRDASLSEDLASETFLEVVRSIGSFRGASDVKTWLFSIARHRWFRYLRQQKREPQTEILTEFLESPGKPTEQIVLDRAMAQRIRELLGEEPERTRRILNLRLEGMSFYEIGQTVGISENSARVIDFRAKARIRTKLQKEGFLDESDFL